jgi:hypothetical protein
VRLFIAGAVNLVRRHGPVSQSEGNQEFVYSVGPDETVTRKINPVPVAVFMGISPHGDWWLSGLNPAHPAVIRESE